MKFLFYDLIFLVAFCIFLFFFLRARKQKIKREGILFLYKTKFGIKFIERTAKKLKKILSFVGWISIFFGFLMMIAIFYLLFKTIFLTIKVPMNVPPLLPLVPYVPQAFKLPLPPFYFFYWIVIIAIVAITHEFSHGIFASHNKVRIKATGFGFLGPFLAAFVEPDEKKLVRKKKKAQLEVFSAGSFSNLIFAILFILLLQLFFVLAYRPAGLAFDFVYSPVNISEIKTIGDYTPEKFFNLSNKELAAINKTIKVETKDKTYYLDKKLIEEIANSRKAIKKYNVIIAYEDAPAINAGLEGGLLKIDEYEIKSIEDVSKALEKYNPGDKVKIVTSKSEYLVTLAKNPKNETKAYLGIAFPQIKGTNKLFASLTAPFFDPQIHVEAKINEQAAIFFRDLLVWLVLICFFVALFNMLPLAFLDGGRMFFVLALAITKSKKKAKSALAIASYIVLFILLTMMLIWLAG
ncbi:MAG: site-2 protease family protein [Candidatus Pacearchaeota archaeon]